MDLNRFILTHQDMLVHMEAFIAKRISSKLVAYFMVRSQQKVIQPAMRWRVYPTNVKLLLDVEVYWPECRRGATKVRSVGYQAAIPHTETGPEREMIVFEPHNNGRGGTMIVPPGSRCEILKDGRIQVEWDDLPRYQDEDKPVISSASSSTAM